MAHAHCIKELPRDVVHNILCSLDNVRWLPSALLSCRTFYSAFTNITVNRVLRNQISSSLLPYAIAACAISQTCPPASQVFESLQDSLELNSKESASKITMIDLSSALKIGQLHEIVKELAIDFTNTCLTQLDLLESDYGDKLSLFEHNRVSCALYRAELYFKLFRRPGECSIPVLSREERNRVFFDPHSPWINEQLACIHDFLEQKISDAGFREVAAHDTFFGELSIDYLSTGEENRWKQHFMSQGLEFISQLAHAATYDKKLELLRSKFDAETASLASALHEANHEKPDKTLLEYDEEELKSLQRSREGNLDSDSGPYDMWSWANQDEITAMFIFSWDKASLRKRGYVMWDRARIADGNMMDIFEKIMSMPQPSLEPTHEEWNEMQITFGKRSRIWQRGGRGFWSTEDESKIVWPESSSVQNTSP